MTGLEALLPFVIAVGLPFVVCFGVARTGNVRTAWWLPAGIAVLTLAFVILGYRLGTEVATGAGVARSVTVLGLPATLGGIAGILLGRRRA